MEVRFLGSHNLESSSTKMSSILIDECIALDAGGLTSSLSLVEQQKIKAILLTHCHYDHIRDVAGIGLAMASFQKSIRVCSQKSTLDVLTTHLINGIVYPKLAETPTPQKPTIRLCQLEPFKMQDIEGYSVLPLPVKHAVPATGYQIGREEGKMLFYSGDTGPGIASLWQHLPPQLLILHVNMPNMLEQAALRFGHLTPRLLAKELQDFKSARGYVPPVIVSHLAQQFEDTVEKESAQVAAELGTTITLAYEGMKINF